VEIRKLPDTYAVALASNGFVAEHQGDAARNYLPAHLLSDRDEWVEMDFYQPDLHEDLADRFITLHTRAYRGRSYFRIFYRYPGGRGALAEYLRRLDAKGVDWRQAAQNGFIDLREDAPQFPAGTEFALVQFMMTLDDRLQPAPTRIVESVRLRVYRNVDGSAEPPTNTGRGMNALEYTMKRRLLFDDLRDGGLHREPDAVPTYRVIFQGPESPDWGYERRKPLVRQCADCHASPQRARAGVRSVPSIVNMGGFDAGAQLGIAVPLPAEPQQVRARRAARWKTHHESYRRLLECLE
jgi:ribosomal protein L34E